MKFTEKVMPMLQRLGQAIIVPIAILPAAAILFRIGSPDLLNIPILSVAGQMIFANLSLLFAIGVALGFTKDSGTAGLAAASGYFVTVGVAHTFDATIDIGVFGGIVLGFVTAALYNKYHNIRLPEYLAFFGGKRFIPIVTSLVCIALGITFGLLWPAIQAQLNNLGALIVESGDAGPAIFMVINRLLLPFGLHHIPNNFVFFQMGTYTAEGITYTGEITRFLQGDPTAGKFLSGFFPILMTGYPAAALAMVHTADKKNRKAVQGIMLSAAFAAFLTGITEPIEFAYIFAAPVLFIANIILSGLAAFVCSALGLTAGFGFSAGFIDYALNWNLSSDPILLLGICAVWSVLFYVVFRFLIVKLNLPTPGRERKEVVENE